MALPDLKLEEWAVVVLVISAPFILIKIAGKVWDYREYRRKKGQNTKRKDY